MPTSRLTLKSGDEVLVRPIRPDDKQRLLNAFERSSPESRYRRFFSLAPRLSAAQLRYLTDVDHHGHEALQAVDPQTNDGLVWPASSARPIRRSPRSKSRWSTTGRAEGRKRTAARPRGSCARGWHRALERLGARENEPVMKLFRPFGDAHVTGREHGVVDLLMDLPHEVLPETLTHTVRAAAQGDVQLTKRPQAG